VPVPYLNLYQCNGAVIVPVTGHPADGDALATLADEFPGRSLVPVDGTWLAFGGGGPHCVTQQVPAVPPAGPGPDLRMAEQDQREAS
jgi:agmatine deiminase